MDLNGLEDFTNSWWPIVISFVISVVGAIRLYAGGAKCPNENRMDGKTVLITGGSSGIGFNVAKELVKRGASVIIACRDLERGNKAVLELKQLEPDAKLAVKLLDVSKLESIRACACELQREYERLDVLINNAGIIFHQHHLTEERLELTFATNYLGPFLLTHLLLPLLEASQQARIINLGATAHKMASITTDNLNFAKEFIYRSAFGQTKLALMLFTKHMANLLRGSKITINTVNPGLVRGTKHLRMSPLGNSWMTRISVLPWTWLFLKSPKQGAQSVIYVATDEKFASCSGEYISDCEIEIAHNSVNDPQLLQEIYQRSCDLCGIKSLS